MSRGNRGASHTPGPRVHPCPKCGDLLRFKLGGYGQSLEKCDNAHCHNGAWHHPEPDPAPPARGGGGAQGMRKKRGPMPTNKSATRPGVW